MMVGLDAEHGPNRAHWWPRAHRVSVRELKAGDLVAVRNDIPLADALGRVLSVGSVEGSRSEPTRFNPTPNDGLSEVRTTAGVLRLFSAGHTTKWTYDYVGGA